MKRQIRNFSVRIFILVCFVAVLSAAQTQAATWTVTRTDDRLNATCVNNVDCTLREAVIAANHGDTITFAQGIGIVRLGDNNTDILIEKNLTIEGSGSSRQVIAGNQNFRVFTIIGTNYVVIFRNVAVINGRGPGGAISNAGAHLTIDNCDFHNNRIENGAGGAIFNSGIMNISNSFFYGNVGAQGGAINTSSSAVTITNTTISGNFAGGGSADNLGGGAIFVRSGRLTINFSTITNNSSPQSADRAGIYAFPDSLVNPPRVSLKNTIVAGNNGGDLKSFDDPNAFSTQGNNLIGKNGGVAQFPAGTPNANNDYVGTEASPLDPQLEALSEGYHLLKNNSPARNRANAAGAPSFDQRGAGFPRFRGSAPDIGAIEMQFALAVPGIYANKAVETGAQAGISPSSAPVNAAQTTVSSSANFKGILTVNQTTGEISVTNAQPAGVYPVTVRAYNEDGEGASRTFNLSVQNRLASTQLVFDQYSPGVSSGVNMIATGDFNGDGRADAVMPNVLSNSISILQGAGFGSFGVRTSISSQGSSPTGVAVGDVNGDGRQDIAVVNQGSKNFVVLLGNGAGGFVPEGAPISVGGQAVGNGYAGIALADFNGDGKLDAAIVNAGAGDNVAVFYRSAAGNGFEAAQNAPTDGTPAALVAGDFNNDGRQDIAVSYGNAQRVSIFYRQASPLPGFSRTDVAAGSVGGTSIVAGDVSGDGRADLVISHRLPGIGTTVLLNTVTSFSFNVTLFTPQSGYSAAIGNFDNADKNEIVLTDNDGSRVLVLSLNAGNTGFNALRTIASGGSSFKPFAAAAADLDGDNVPEILFTESFNNQLRAIWRNRIYEPANSEPFFQMMARNGIYSVRPLWNSPNQFPVKVAVGDFNGDGSQDVATANGLTPTISILTGNGSGQLSTPAAQISFSADPNAFASDLAVADFNGDGHQDIAVFFGDSADSKLGIFYNNGGGSFAFTEVVASSVGSFAAGDFNRDGRPDLVVGGGSGLRVLLRNAANTDFIVATTLNVAAGKIKIADFNGDGKTDLIALVGGAMTCFLGDGAGGFTREGAGYNVVDYVEAADFNGDSKTDIAGINQGAGTMYVLLRNVANNGFDAEAASYSVGNNISDMTSGDFDGDLRQDVAFARNGIIGFFTRNAANAGFAQSATVSDSAGQFLGVGDLNRDGRLDLVAATSVDTISVILRQSSINFDRRTLPNGSTAQMYNQTIRVGGGAQPYTFSVSGLPAGMSFTSGADGVTISGVPSQSGTFYVAVAVSDSSPLAENLIGGDLSPQAANQATQIFQLQIGAPTAAAVIVGGRVTDAGGRGIRNALVTMTGADGQTRTAATGASGYFRFAGVTVGETYVFTVRSKKFSFAQNSQIRAIVEETDDIIFVAEN